ncbi:hypothetical protein DDD63_07450 [Actinobaculum sp. 313]|nr:hypothetical protein DDD63_07450 [Actinobaculum sp. 313]
MRPLGHKQVPKEFYVALPSNHTLSTLISAAFRHERHEDRETRREFIGVASVGMRGECRKAACGWFHVRQQEDSDT